MRISARNSFAVSLFVGAAIPVAILAAFLLGSPISVVNAYVTVTGWIWYAVLGAVVAFVVATPYPPFVPTLRLRSRKAWRRLGTDRGPLFEGLAQLRNLETHANRLLVGRIARGLGDVKIALENLERAYALEPTHVSGRYQLALLYEELGRLDEAAKFFAEVVEADESHAFGDALLHFGQVLFRRGHAAESLDILRRHQQCFPGNRQVHLLASYALTQAGDLEAARTELLQARRPAKERELLPLEETIARARARVTRLPRGGAS